MLGFLLPLAWITDSRAQEQTSGCSQELASAHWKSAESLCRQQLARNPASAPLLTNLGIALQMQGHSSEAIANFRKSLRIKYQPMTYALLAEEQCKIRDVERAAPMLDRLLRENAKAPRILAIVAPCYLEAEKPLESVTVYQTLANTPQFPRDLALVQLIRSYVAAAGTFVSRLKMAPGSEAYLQAIAAVRADGTVDARSAFAIAQQRSAFFRANDDFEQAVATWRLHPQDAALLYQLSVLANEAVLRTFEQCSEQFPDSPYLAEFHAEVLAQSGRPDEAVAALEALAQAHPDLPDLSYTLGMIYRKQGNWEKAAACFKKQVDADPQDERSAARLSEALLNLSQFEALRSFLAARMNPQMKSGPAPMWSRLDLATAEQKLGDPKAAIALLLAAEREDPANAAVHYRLMRLYGQAGDAAAATREGALFARFKH